MHRGAWEEDRCVIWTILLLRKKASPRTSSVDFSSRLVDPGRLPAGLKNPLLGDGLVSPARLHVSF